MKKLLLFIFILLGFATTVYAAPQYTTTRTILPEIDSWSELGTSTRAWLRIFSDDAYVLNLGGSGTRCVQVDNDGKLAKAASGCGSGGSGGSDANWTFFNGSGIYPSTTTNQVVIGESATTSRATLEAKALNAAGGAFYANGSTTLQNFTFRLATGTAATTTNFTISSLSSELLKVNGSGAILEAIAGTDYEVPLTFGDGLTRTANDVDVDTTQNIAKLSNLTSNGLVKTSGGDGTLSVDTTTYESGLTAGDGLTRTANDFDCDTASGSVFGCLSAADWTTFNGKQATISATWPITLSGATVGFNGLSTSTAAVVGNIPYYSGANTFANVATTSLTATSPLSLSQPVSVIGSSASALSLSTAGDWTGTLDSQEGSYYLSRTNHTGTQSATTITAGAFPGGLSVYTFSSSLYAAGSSTLHNFTARTSTTTSATTTNLAITSITGSTQCLRADASGVVSGTGADCGSGSGGAYPFAGAGNSTSTLTQFNGGLTAYASSTIGGGTGASGLTVYGTATTSALYVSGTATLAGGATITCAGCITNTNLANSTVSYGGVQLSLGGTDATPAFNLADATGLPISTGVSGLGTGVATALGVNVGSAGAFVTLNGALGTPSSGTLTNATGLPIVNGTTGTLTVARGGTGLTTFGGANHVLYTTAADTLASEAAFTYSAGGDLLTMTNASTTRLTVSGYTILGSGGSNVGVGTTTPNWTLNVASTTPAVTVTDTNAPANAKHWILGNHDGIFTIGTSTDALTSTSTALQIGTGVPSFNIGSTTQTVSAVPGLLIQTTNGENGSSTQSVGKWQVDMYNSAGTRSCMFVVGTTLTVIAGACNP